MLTETDDEGTARKVRRHLLPLLFVLYVVAYLDRVNVGFASLTMNRELALTSEQYGLLSGIFFWGYFLLEIPSNLVLHRLGARTWIARILITWGLVAVCTGFVQNVTQLYVARFMLGAAEAGFYPGIVYYLSYWFRQRDQAQAIGVFLTALPTASILGGPASGWILDHVHAFGLSGWRWLLIIEALPAVACGLLTYRWLPDRPTDATFLTTEEKVRLVAALSTEADVKPGAPSMTVLKTLTHPRVLHLAATQFLFLMGLYVTGFWMPQSIKSVATDLSNTAVGILIIIPNAAGLVSMALVARSSDRCAERHFHAVIPLLCAAAALYFVGGAPSVALCVALWCVATAGLDSYLGPFWAIPGEFLTGRSAACGFAFINSVGNLGAYFGLSAIGSIATKTGSLNGGFRAVSAALVCAAMLILALKLHRPWTRAGDSASQEAV
ncbi:MAG TPA: MFS transporter [Steroidobacteraceae bacterium]|jgi:ACS family tartrate transporter-like MFS transporter|nr:MFS transporter [Steroidobacteraceae bacterium]